MFLSLLIGSEAVVFLAIGLTTLLIILGWGLSNAYTNLTGTLNRLDGKVDEISDTVNTLRESIVKMDMRLEVSKARLDYLASENKRLVALVNKLFRSLHAWDVHMARRFPGVAFSVRLPEMEVSETETESETPGSEGSGAD